MSSDLRPDVKAAADRIPSKFGVGKELRTLPGELWDGETVRQIVPGMYGKGNGVLVLTDRRLLFYFRGVVNSQTEDFGLDRISSIDFRSGLLLGEVTVHVTGNKATIKNVDKNLGKELVDNVRGAIAHASTPTAATGESVPDQLLKLKALADAGILTPEQYEAKSAPLIARL